MTTVFLGDTFSLDEPRYLGRPIANATLARSIFMSDQVERVLAVGSPDMYRGLGLPDAVAGKLLIIPSIGELVNMFRRENVAAIFCSSFGKKYAELIHFRNLNELCCPVFGFTHTLSYQDEVGALYRLFCSGIQEKDGILCTSNAAIDVMTRLLATVRGTLSFETREPRLIHFPLGYEAAHSQEEPGKCPDHFQILFLGRLNWMNKADVLVIPRILDSLPEGHNVRFIIAGASDNEGYLNILRQYCNSPFISVLVNVSDEEKNRLYRESHILLSPSDNYQETFGLSVIEAKHHGCVPVVSDFNGYRDLVEHGEDGVLLETYAARIPENLWKLQTLMPINVYHGWWAAGVSIDPKQAADTIFKLSVDRKSWKAMSSKGIESVSRYNLESTANRFSRLLESVESESFTPSDFSEQCRNPFHIDYSDIFRNHPTSFWSGQAIELTQTGSRFLLTPDMRYVPQLMLLAEAVTLSDITDLLDGIGERCSAEKLLASGIEPIVLSVALKNGLITVSGNGPDT